ncbi:MAG: peptidoglycan D,D-transpeptidase FtsI family protein [Candidatus Limnocylindrales bacterium]
MLGRTDSRGRLLLLFIVLTLLSGGMVARLAYWQVNQREQLTAMAGGPSAVKHFLPAKRGTIYDRTGTIVLAETIYQYRLIADLHGMDPLERQRETAALVDYLDLTGDKETALRKAMAGDGYYVVLAKDVDADVANEISQAQAVGALAKITLEPTPVRVYPQAGGAPRTSLAAQVLGFVNASGAGQYGLEQQYDAVLAGTPEVVQIDPNTPGPAGTTVLDPGTPGEDIRTTIDVGLQLQVEQELFATWIADKAKSVSAIVMEPKTGAILAEGTYPSYDANLYGQVAAQNPSLFMDPIISEIYEPGSVFKMLTASAALETKTTALTTKINDSGVMKLPGDQEVADADRKSMGWLSFADVVAWSRNVGASQVAFRLGKTVGSASATLYQTWQEYGIGQKTGVDLAGEVAGIVRDPAVSPWSQIDLANASFGQGVAVTPMQVICAYSAMANGGTSVKPHVAEQDAAQASASPSQAAQPRIISPNLSDSLTGLMTHVVTAVPSYAQSTYIPGYFVGGKTGTAQIWDPTLDKGKGGWLSDIYNYSFYGWVGHSSPDATIGLVIYQGTPTKVSQGVLAMPVQSTELFRRIATDAVTTLQIPANKNGPAAPGGKKAKSLG